MKTRLRILLAAFAVIVASSTYADGLIRTVALSGENPPGGIDNLQFFAFGPPVINADGSTAFTAYFDDMFLPAGQGVWAERKSGGLRLAASAVNMPVGTPSDTTFLNFREIAFNDAEEVAFRAVFSNDEDEFGEGVWSESTNIGVQPVLLTGASPPGVAPDVIVDSLPDFVQLFDRNVAIKFNNAGQTAIRGHLAGPDIGSSLNNDFGLWSNHAGGSLLPIAIMGDPAAGYSNGINFIGLGVPALNNQGQILFHALHSNIVSFMLANPDGTLQEVVRVGQQVSGFPAGVTFALFRPEAVLNDRGDIAFYGATQGPGMGDGNLAIWKSIAGSPFAPALRKGQTAPGTEIGTTFDDFERSVINAHGKLAFVAILDGVGVTVGENDAGLWAETSSGPTLIMRRGDHVPGLPDDVTFIGPVANSYFPFEMNAVGQVVFEAHIYGPASDIAGRGIWATDIHGRLQMIALEGQQIDVDDGAGVDLRTIHQLQLANPATGNEDGISGAMNDKGQIAFWAEFTDNTSGIFASNVVAVPEPMSLTIGVLGILASTCYRRRRVTIESRRSPSSVASI